MQIVFQDQFFALNPRHGVSDILATPYCIHSGGRRVSSARPRPRRPTVRLRVSSPLHLGPGTVPPGAARFDIANGTAAVSPAAIDEFPVCEPIVADLDRSSASLPDA